MHRNVVLPLLLITAMHLNAFEYEISGHFQYEEYKGNTNNVWKQERPFRVSVIDNNWWIQTIRSEPGKTDAVFELGATNTETIFEIVHPSIPINSQSASNNPGALGNDVTNKQQPSTYPKVTPIYEVAKILPISMPLDLTDRMMGHIWMMFASHAFFRANTNAFLPPLYDLNASAVINPNYKLETARVIMDKEPYLPCFVSFFNPGKVPFKKDEKGNLVYSDLPAPYNSGFTNAIYQITGETNIGGMRLPTGFKFEWFKPGNYRSKEDLYLNAKAVATVHEIKTISSRKTILPQMVNKATVFDYRLPEATGKLSYALYMNQKDRWMTVSEVKKIQTQRKEMKDKQAKTPYWVFGIVGVVLLPVLVIIALQVKQKIRNSTE